VDYVSPIDERAADPVPFASRPAAIAGRRVVLLDITKNRGSEFLDRIERQLRSRGAETFRIAKETFSKPASSEVIERVAIHGDLAVEGLAD
jgi:hypothetical protein